LDDRANSDTEEFIRLYRKHYDGVFRYCVHRLFDRTIAEDVTSKVFLKAVENFGRFSGDDIGLRNWLYTIATNAVNNYLRTVVRHNGQLKYLAQDSGQQDAGYEFSVEQIAILKIAMLSLKPKYQTIITLRFFEKMNIDEIAGLFHSSPGTVRSQLSRALATLRTKMNVENDTF
jgi:RNA polymerase sigma-70 factor, ECF subfamily